MLLDQYKKKAQLYRTNVLLVPLGDDFRYDNWKEVESQYSNYQQLIDYMNSHSELNVKAQIGTLSDYFDALRRSPEASDNLGDFPVLTGDFYTYSDRDEHYWSGYYTSRPFYKRFDRILETNLRAADILFSFGLSRGLAFSSTLYQKLVDARRSLGLFQHHDGITGTAREKVVVDYGLKVLQAIHNSQYVMSTLVQDFLGGGDSSGLYLDVNRQQTTHNTLPTLLHISVQRAREVILYNSLASKRVHLVRLEVDSLLVSISNTNGEGIPCQINPIWTDDTAFATDRFELVFPVSMEGISLLRYRLSPSSAMSCSLAEIRLTNPLSQGPASSLAGMEDKFGVKFPVTVNAQMSSVTLETVSMMAEFNGQTGLLSSLSANGATLPVSLEFVMYGAKNIKEKSGAYLFIPDGPASSIVTRAQHFVRIVTGDQVKEVHTKVRQGLVHKVILENIPGPAGRSMVIVNDVNIQQESNKELAMRLRTGVRNSDKVFYTDLNGFHLVHRKTQSKIPLQGNFYPVPSMAQLEDKNTRLSLLSAQPLGGAALEEGWLEVMLERRLMQDDNRGLGQPLKDNLLTRSLFRLLVEPVKGNPPLSTIAYPSLLAHMSSMDVLHPLQVFVAKETMPSEALVKQGVNLAPPLPCDLHLVTLRTHHQLSGSQTALVLHRKGFSCFHGNNVDCKLKEGKVHLGDFLGVEVKKASKTSLTMMDSLEVLSDFNIQVEPMELQTFSVEF
jgi:alpha-mannosidase II